MSVVAISETLGSLGAQVGLELAHATSLEFYDREILSKAAEEYNQGVTALEHVTEERPTFWERWSDAGRRAAAFVEATIVNLAARGGVVLCGRGSAFYLRPVPHALRVRVTAPEPVRARRVARAQGVSDAAALELVRRSDRERAARVRAIHGVDWRDPGLYDLVLSTERLDPSDAAGILRETLRLPRFQPTPVTLAVVEDLRLAARARAELLRHPATEHLRLQVACAERVLTLRGRVHHAALRALVEELVGEVPGVRAIRNEVVVLDERLRLVHGV